MKKLNKNPKALLLSVELVRMLDDAQLRAVAGGKPACPSSVVKICDVSDV